MPTESGLFDSDRDKARRTMSPNQLYADCLAAEAKLTKNPPSVEYVLEGVLFGGRVFFDGPVGGTRFFRTIARSGQPFQIMAAPPAQLRVSKYEWRYRKILQLLKEQTDPEIRWILVAKWLKQEGICEPHQFLPEEFRRNLIKRYRQLLPMSPTDLFHRALIRNWRIYFERIRTELKKRERVRRAREEVQGLGFKIEAIELIAKKKSSDIEAICQWLHQRGMGDPRKLRNSYSRLHAHSKKHALELEFGGIVKMHRRSTPAKK
ncbi:MAG: hypothetical protein WAU89_15185 [Candidatus Acidiferrales bacterium]